MRQIPQEGDTCGDCPCRHSEWCYLLDPPKKLEEIIKHQPTGLKLPYVEDVKRLPGCIKAMPRIEFQGEDF